MSLDASRHQHFDGSPGSSRAVRHAVLDALTGWGCDAIADDAVLCAAELAANAILHAAGAYELSIQRVPAGARIEVIDARPDVVPAVVPTTGSARALTSDGTTGRGLQIVAMLASRWGYTTSANFKSVWMEITDPIEGLATDPVVVDGHRESTDPAARPYHLASMPVRAAVGSGVHVEDLIRVFQLTGTGGPMGDEELTRFRSLLHISAPARLLGRHAALNAAAKDQTRYTIDVRLSPEVIVAFGALNELLGEVSSRLGAEAVPLPQEVVDLRGWIMSEIVRQTNGDRSTACSLPD